MTDQVMHFLRVLSEGGAFKSGPIAEFMAYAKENGPAARKPSSHLGRRLVTLLRGAAQAGPGMLTLVTAAAKLVAALPPELVGIILSVASALKLLQLTGAGMAALAGGLARVRTAIVLLAAASAAAGRRPVWSQRRVHVAGHRRQGHPDRLRHRDPPAGAVALSEMGKKAPPTSTS
jgi:hypothetical protein